MNLPSVVKAGRTLRKVLFPILGGLVLAGIAIDVGIGYSIAGGAARLRDIHTYIGYAGVVLGLILTVLAWRSKTATSVSKGLMTALFLALIAQVWVGQGLVAGSVSLVRFHEALGILILVLAMGEAAVTSIAAKRRARAR